MRIVTTSYINTAEFLEPLSWLDRINFHVGTLEQLAQTHEVISIEQINYSGELRQNKVCYQFLNFQRPKLYFPNALHRHIKKLQPNAVIVHGLHFPLQVMQLRQKLEKKCAIIVQNHAERPHKGWRRWLQQKADASINHYLFTSAETGREWVQRGIIADERKIAEVMEASSVFNDRRTLENDPVNKPVFLWVGRLDQNKDPLTVVLSFLKFVDEKPGAKLYMIFQEDHLLPEIKRLLEENRKETSVELVGKVAHNNLPHYYQKADFFLSASHYEGSGIAACEAMSCGCIPILTCIPSFRKMTGRGKCGLLYSPGNAEELLACLRKTVTLNIEAEREKVLQQFREELSFAAIASKINEVLLKTAET